GRLGEVEDELDGGDGDPGQDHCGDDRPDGLRPGVAVELHRRLLATALPVLEQEENDRSLDQDEDDDDDDEDLAEQVVGPAGVRPGGTQSVLRATGAGNEKAAEAGESGSHDGRLASPDGARGRSTPGLLGGGSGDSPAMPDHQ